MSKWVSLIGRKFGLLTVLDLDPTRGRGKKKRRFWKCECACGNITSVVTDALVNDLTHSCGCQMGKSHGMSYTRQYNIWKGAKTRCMNKNDTSFHHYGGRGITICDKWLTFEGFWEDMRDGYCDNLTLDRVDVNGNYEKGNCRWVTMKDQGNNKRNTVFHIIDGEKMCHADIAKKFNISVKNLCNRLDRGWCIEMAAKTPVDVSKGYTRGMKFKLN